MLTPIHALGLTNAWLGTLSLTLLGMLAVQLHPRGDRLADASWYGEEELRWARISTAINLGLLFYSLFVPLRLGSLALLVGAALFGTGLVAAIWAYVSFLNTPEDEPVVRGLYRLSRNPIYVSTWLALLGICVAATSWILLLLAVAWLVPTHRLVLAEERHCRPRYGADYQAYLRRVSRYLPLLPGSGRG